MEGKNLFRKESLEKIESPEQLNDYLKVTTPRIWIGLVAVIALLLGLLAFIRFGTLESTIPGTAVVKDGVVEVTVTQWRNLKDTSKVRLLVSGDRMKTTSINLDKEKEGFAVLRGKTRLPDGEYSATVLMETIPAFSFLDNNGESN